MDPTVEWEFVSRVRSDLEAAPFEARIVITAPPDGSAGLVGLHLTLRTFIEAETSGFSVLDVVDAQSAAGAAVARKFDFIVGLAPVKSVRVGLAVPASSLQLAERREESRRRMSLAAAEHSERDSLLRERVLTDPVALRLWWLDGQRDRLHELMALEDTFERVVCTFGKAADSPSPSADVARIIETFLSGLGRHHREYLLEQVARVLCGYERDDLANEIRSKSVRYVDGSASAPESRVRQSHHTGIQ